jgi:S-adenosylmethionine uptake transporter
MSRTHSPGFVFGIAVVGIAIFSAMDAVMKGLTIAVGAYNALLWRTRAIFVMSGIVYLVRRPPRPSRVALKLHAIRGVVSAVMAFLFFWGLARVPIAQSIALCYIAPLLALFLAAALLGERITRATILASLIASAGVGVILLGQAQTHSSDEAFLGILATLGSAVCYSYNIILMRQQALVARPDEITFFQSVTVGFCFLLAAPWLAVVPPVAQLGPIVLAALLASVSLLLLSWAYARGEASYLAPTEYRSFVWATFFGFTLFQEVPSSYTLGGAALIIGGCLLAMRRRAPSSLAADVEAAI